MSRVEKMSCDPSRSWSYLALRLFLDRFAEHARSITELGIKPPELLSAQTVGDDRVEVIARSDWFPAEFGVRIDGAMILSDLYASAEGRPLREAPIESVVQDMIHLMIDEPFDGSEVDVIDDEGVRWRTIFQAKDGRIF